MTIYYIQNEFIFPNKEKCDTMFDAIIIGKEQYGIQVDEFALGFDEMLKAGHNIMQFGELQGSFMWSEKLVS